MVIIWLITESYNSQHTLNQEVLQYRETFLAYDIPDSHDATYFLLSLTTLLKARFKVTAIYTGLHIIHTMLI